MKTPSAQRPVLAGFLAGALLASQSSQAATQYSVGTFTWDSGTTVAWGAASGGPYGAVWTSGNDAVFEGTAGTVSIDSAGVVAHNPSFNTTNHILSGAGTLTLNASSPTLTTGSGITASIGNNTATSLAGSSGLTKAGTGTLTLNGAAVNSFTGGLIVNAGTLLLDFSNLATPTNLITNSNTLKLGGGTLALKGRAGGVTTSQTLGNLTMTAGTASKILLDPNAGTATTLALGSLATISR
jgi:fibronectin-binding autotransporter adhesin